MNKRVIVQVFPDGSSHVDSQGFVGTSCSIATRELELALAGDDPSNREERKKPDFFATTGQAAHINAN